MIDYIEYTVDGKSYRLNSNNDNTWSTEANAPDVTGNYLLKFEVSENGMVTSIDSTDSKYATYLQVVETAQKNIKLIKYLPDFQQGLQEYQLLFDIVGRELDHLELNKEKVKDDMYLTSASNDAVTRIEKFINVKGMGTLEQRKSYLISLFQKGKKINGQKISEMIRTIMGSGCILSFFDAVASDNSQSGFGLLKIQVLNPDGTKDYRYKDIERTLRPLIPAHIGLSVMRYFATWTDIKANFSDFSVITSCTDWQQIKDYIPPQ